jgi:hypothetical protein
MFMTMDVNLSGTSSLSSTGPAQEQDLRQIMLDKVAKSAFDSLFKRRPIIEKPGSQAPKVVESNAPAA